MWGLWRGPKEPQSRRGLRKKAGKGQFPVAPSLNWVGSWALSTAHPVHSGGDGDGDGDGARICTAVSWGFGGREGPLPRWSPVSRESALAQTSALPTEKEKTYQRKSRLQMSPRPALPSLFPCPAALGTRRTAQRRARPSSGAARGHDTGLEGRGWWPRTRPRRSVGRCVRGRESVRVPGHQTLASSISRKSLCMGTLPCSLTL